MSVTLVAVTIVLGVVARVRQVPDQAEQPVWAQLRRPDRLPWTRWALFAAMSALIAGALVVGYEIARPR